MKCPKHKEFFFGLGFKHFAYLLKIENLRYLVSRIRSRSRGFPPAFIWNISSAVAFIMPFAEKTLV